MQALRNSLFSVFRQVPQRSTLPQNPSLAFPMSSAGLLATPFQIRPLSTLLKSPSSILSPTLPLLTSVRTVIFEGFPRPRETKRIRKHGWKKRMSTPGGRKVIMRRILKGRHTLTH